MFYLGEKIETVYCIPGTDVINFKIFLPKNLVAKLPFNSKNRFFQLLKNCGHNIDPGCSKAMGKKVSMYLWNFLRKTVCFSLTWRTNWVQNYTYTALAHERTAKFREHIEHSGTVWIHQGAIKLNGLSEFFKRFFSIGKISIHEPTLARKLCRYVYCYSAGSVFRNL
jgi:hypothetical protein